MSSDVERNKGLREMKTAFKLINSVGSLDDLLKDLPTGSTKRQNPEAKQAPHVGRFLMPSHPSYRPALVNMGIALIDRDGQCSLNNPRSRTKKIVHAFHVDVGRFGSQIMRESGTIFRKEKLNGPTTSTEDYVQLTEVPSEEREAGIGKVIRVSRMDSNNVAGFELSLGTVADPKLVVVSYLDFGKFYRMKLPATDLGNYSQSLANEKDREYPAFASDLRGITSGFILGNVLIERHPTKAEEFCFYAPDVGALPPQFGEAWDRPKDELTRSIEKPVFNGNGERRLLLKGAEGKLVIHRSLEEFIIMGKNEKVLDPSVLAEVSTWINTFQLADAIKSGDVSFREIVNIMGAQFDIRLNALGLKLHSNEF